MFRRKYLKIQNLFSLIEKEVTRIDRNGEEVTKTIPYRLKFIDTAIFITSSLSNLVNDLPEGILKVKCKIVIHVVLNTQTLKII